MTRSRRPLQRLVFVLAFGLIAGALPASAQVGADRRPEPRRAIPDLSFVPRDALYLSLRAGRIDEATYALERVRSLFDEASVTARYGDIDPAPLREATMLMRDLAVRLPQLSPSERRSARKVFARPTDGANPFPSADYGNAKSKNKCSNTARLCFFWATSGRHAPPNRDENGNNIPDWVDTTIREFEEVWQAEVSSLGYRRPKSDAKSQNHGPNEYTDIYLSDVGDEQVYGYCTTDDPRSEYLQTRRYPYSDVSAYCVVDDDFARSQFPSKDPLTNLQVTAAHEFFHAIQFAYDFWEDAWLMEGTAAAMEDDVFDDADDNYQYLVASPLARPSVPVDRSSNDFFKPSFLNRYGAWVFWRFMTEYLDDNGVRDPGVMREVWKRADASPRQAFGDQYSLQAAVGVARDHGVSFKDLFGDFGALNFIADVFYEEGVQYQQVVEANCVGGQGSPCSSSTGGRPPLSGNWTLSSDETTGRRVIELDHLASGYVQVNRGTVTTAAFLNIRVNGPDTARGAKANLILFDGNDVPTSAQEIDLDESGNGDITVPFGTSSRAVLTLTHASTHFRCWRQKPSVSTSCQGIPRYDNADYAYTARVLDT